MQQGDRRWTPDRISLTIFNDKQAVAIGEYDDVPELLARLRRRPPA
jgi:hypothetical protein